METQYHLPSVTSVNTSILYFAGTLQNFTKYTLKYEMESVKTEYLEVIYGGTSEVWVSIMRNSKLLIMGSFWKIMHPKLSLV